MENQTLKECSCTICGGEAISFLFLGADYITAETFNIYKCRVCNSVATKPDLKTDDFQKYYPQAYYGQRKTVTDSWINRSRLQKVSCISDSKNIVSKKTLLDVGCGDGSFISLLAAQGWGVAGTEMASPGSYAMKAPNFICRGELGNCGFAMGSFDIVTMWHSLEHFTDPLTYLREAQRLLKQDGVLLLEVPNFGSWEAKIFKQNWFHLDVPRHVFHYDIKSLLFILNKTGFRITKTSTVSFFYGLFGLVQSSLNVVCRRKNLLFDMINKKINRSDLKKNLKDAFVTCLLTIPVSVAAAVFFLVATLFKKGSIITVWAEKIQQKLYVRD